MRHQLCLTPQDWQFSTIHRFIQQGVYPQNWGMIEVPEVLNSIWDI
ncbi:hypothetical protein [Nostoc edaphicum]|nr:hypothetical protein [Nostoc edaphicum]